MTASDDQAHAGSASPSGRSMLETTGDMPTSSTSRVGIDPSAPTTVGEPTANGASTAVSSTISAARARQMTMILTAALAVVCMLAWLQWRSYAAAAAGVDHRLSQLDRMRADVAVIESLRKAPQAAASRSKPSEELLAQVETSLSAAGIDRDHWQDSIPQPAVRLPKSDYKRLTTRLYFEAITLQQLASFATKLQRLDPTLSVSAINLTNRHPDGPMYNIDVSVSCLVYAPQRVANGR